jgi:glycosyltransferase involved in cell wall biosynthesis
MIRILFTHYGDKQIRGSERCLLDLVKHLDRRRFVPVVWCNGEQLAREMRELDAIVYQTDFPILFGWYDSRYDFQRFRAIVRQGEDIVRTHSIDILHANSGAPNQWLNLVARRCKLPLVSHLHSRYPLRDRFTLGLHHTSQVVGVSQPIVQQLLDDGIDPGRVQVIPNGIDTEHQDRAEPVNLRPALGLREQDFIAFTAASLIHRKGVDLLIHAVAKLRRRQLPVHLVIAGDGPEKESLQALSRQCEVEHAIHFLGSRDDVPGILRGGVDAFVSGAREEVFGLALAEANLASIPVIAPAVGGIPGVIADNLTGLLVPVENNISIAQAIFCLHDHPELKRKLGKAGRQRVLNCFRIENYVAHFEALYLELYADTSRQLRPFSNISPRSLLGMLSGAGAVCLRNTVLSKSTGSASQRLLLRFRQS